MASLLSPSPINLQQNCNYTNLSPLKPTFRYHTWSPTSRSKCSNLQRCNANLVDIQAHLLELEGSLSQLPAFQSVLMQFEELSDLQKWGFGVFGGLTWVYLTARPGVLIGAIDAYVLAPLQLGLKNLSGRKLRRMDFLIGDKLGEGSFGVVYSGVMVPKNVTDQEKLQSRRGKSLQLYSKFNEKVILKKVTSCNQIILLPAALTEISLSFLLLYNSICLAALVLNLLS